MTKQEQNEEMVNISTKEEIEARNKRDKEKDELRQALLHYATAEASGGIKSLIDCEGCAFYLYENLGYRKVSADTLLTENQLKKIIEEEYKKALKGKVVLTTEECQDLVVKSMGNFSSAMVEARKETAEKFLQLAYDRCLEKSFIKKVEELAEQFGVEIKE